MELRRLLRGHTRRSVQRREQEIRITMKTYIKGKAKTSPVLCCWLLFIVFCIMVIPSLGDINLTISSANNKTITVIQPENSIVEGTMNQSETIQLSYVNHQVKVVTENTITLDNFQTMLHRVMEHKTLVMAFILFLLLVFGFAILWM